MPECVAITGGIGSGKSTVARILGELGAAVISADKLARDIVAPGEPALREIEQRFGREILLPSGELDRKRLAARVFASDEERRALEQITHPRIRERFREAVRSHQEREPSRLLIYDVPLLFEAGVPPEVTKVVVVSAPEAVCLQRVTARDGVSQSEALQRLKSQIPLTEKVARADIVLHNDSNIDTLRQKVVDLYKALRR